MVKLIELFAKLFSQFSQKVLKRGGETWPGEIALKLDPQLPKKLKKNFDQIICIVGTNGKTSTSKLLVDILRKSGKKVITNPSGANQLNGIVSSILTQKRLIDNQKYVGVFEVDEFAFPAVAQTLCPNVVLILNLLRDQMDRYGEVGSIAARWKEVLKTDSLTVVANASDPGVYALVDSLPRNITKKYYGVPQSLLQKSVKVLGDFVYCPKCGTKFDYEGHFVSHIGDWFCPHCHFKPAPFFTFTQKQLTDYVLLPAYFVVNAQGVSIIANILKLSNTDFDESMLHWQPAFGRGEKVVIDGKTYTFYLGKNPASWTVVFDTVPKDVTKDTILILGLNNRIPDGHDVSWIWDAEINLKFKIQNLKYYIFGDRAFDMGMRLKVEGLTVSKIEPQVVECVKLIKSAPEKNVIIIANYSALLEIRKEITGKAIL